MQDSGVDDVGRHQTGREQGGKEGEECQKVSGLEVLLRQNVGKHGHDQQTQSRAAEGIEDGHAVAAEQAGTGFNNTLIGFQRETGRNELIAVICDGFCAGERDADDQEQGQNACNGQKGQEKRHHNVGAGGNLIDLISFLTGSQCSIHSLHHLIRT